MNKPKNYTEACKMAIEVLEEDIKNILGELSLTKQLRDKVTKLENDLIAAHKENSDLKENLSKWRDATGYISPGIAKYYFKTIKLNNLEYSQQDNAIINVLDRTFCEELMPNETPTLKRVKEFVKAVDEQMMIVVEKLQNGTLHTVTCNANHSKPVGGRVGMSEEIEKVQKALEGAKSARKISKYLGGIPINISEINSHYLSTLIEYAEDRLSDDISFEEFDKKTNAEIKADLAAKGYTEESLKASRRKLALSISPELKLELEEIRAVIGDLKEAWAKDQFDNAWLDTLSLNSKINKLL